MLRCRSRILKDHARGASRHTESDIVDPSSSFGDIGHYLKPIWARRPDSDVAVSRDINAARRCTWPDPEGQEGPASHVADEEVCFVGSNVPGLRRKSLAVVLFEPNGGRVAGIGVDV